MAGYILSNKAIADLSAIWDYTFEVWSEEQADKYYYILLEHCQALADDKAFAKNYPDINKDIFGSGVGQHIIFYQRLKVNKVEIVRILHSSMDLKNKLNG